MEHHIPVLPIAVESGLEEYFAVEMNRIHDGYGDIQLLRSEVTDWTEISYYQKLARDLGAILLENEEVERIKQAFSGKIFLSYRKKDRKYADELMHTIHSIPSLRNVSIWFDEFMSAGEKWSDQIGDALKQSDVFLLLVSPSITEPDNYVIRKEYPSARNQGKTIVSAGKNEDKTEAPDIEELRQIFPGLRVLVDGDNADELENALQEITSEAESTPEKVSEGKLYYSYITGGFLGSIDTINYDKRYAEVVKAFEEQTSYLVYHVIERGNTISLLFVSDDYNHWLEERPTASGVMAQVVDMDTYENELGFIRVYTNQGALYRSNDTVYSSMPGSDAHVNGLSALDTEIAERLEILKNAGLMSDFDITKVYIREGEICCSLLRSVLGTAVGVVNRISSSPQNMQLLEMIQEQVPMKLYFLLDSTQNKLAFLYVSEDESNWEYEKLALEKGRPLAVVVDLDEMTAGVKQIRYEMVNGGPIFVD